MKTNRYNTTQEIDKHQEQTWVDFQIPVIFKYPIA